MTLGIFLMTVITAVLLDSLRVIRFFLTKGSEPNFLASIISRSLPALIVALITHGFHFLPVLFFLLAYGSTFWLFFNSVYDFGFPEAARKVYFPAYTRRVNEIDKGFAETLPGWRGVTVKFGCALVSITAYILFFA